jgi:hypothetical protein
MLSPGHSPHFAAYRNALKAISARTGTPLPSLLVSFGILHELTAAVPLIGVFYGARSLGIGEGIIAIVVQDGAGSVHNSHVSDPHPIPAQWVREKCKAWVDEGEHWAGRIGRRYGIFGLEKRISGAESDTAIDLKAKSVHTSGQIAGDVANAIVAYGVTKVGFFYFGVYVEFSLLKARP